MGGAVILTGAYKSLNSVAASDTVVRGLSTIGPDQLSTDFPLRYLGDGEIGTISKLNIASDATQVIAIDLNRVVNGAYGDWTRPNLPDYWIDNSIGDGAIAEETTIFQSGPSSAKLSTPTSSDRANMSQTILIKPEESFTASVALRGDGTNTISAYIWFPETGQYVNSAGSLVTTRTAFHSRSTASFSTNTQAFSGPILDNVQTDTIEMVMEVDRPGATNAVGYVDEFFCWPLWNFSAIFGHNLPDNITVSIQSDDNAVFSSPTTRLTFPTPRNKKAFYHTLSSAVSERYVRLSIGGPTSEPPWVGEWVISLITLLSPGGIKIPLRIKNTAGISGIGAASANKFESTSLEATFPWTSRAVYEDLRVILGTGSRWGGRSSILIPIGPNALGSTTGSQPDIYMGRLQIETITIDHDDKYEIECEMEELEYPNFVK